MLKKSTYRLVDGVPTVTCRIKADIKSMEVLDSGSKSDYMLRAHGGMTGKAKEAAVRHIHSYLTAVTEKQKSTDTDFLKLGRKFYANLGREWTTFSAITSDYLQTTVYDINIEL